MSLRVFLSGCLVVLLGLCCVRQAYGQVATGTVVGTVTDASGAVVAGAQVELLNTGTNVSQTVQSNLRGEFIFPTATPGASYSVIVKAPGFQTFSVNDVSVQVNSSSRVNCQLVVGQATATVQVTATAAEALQTTNATVGDVISTQPLLRLPTRLRQAQELLLLQPGTTPDTGGDNGASIAGAQNDQTTFTFDGIDISDNSTNSTINSDQGARPVLMVSVEATDESRCATTGAGSSFARGSGGQVSLVERSGTNNFHGSGFWYGQQQRVECEHVG